MKVDTEELQHVVGTKQRCDECRTYVLEDYGDYLFCIACNIRYPKVMAADAYPSRHPEASQSGAKACMICNGRYDGTWANHKGECRK